MAHGFNLPGSHAQRTAAIVDKPLIQYAAEEVIAAGIDTLIFVMSRDKCAIEEPFDNNQELEMALRAKGKMNKPRWSRTYTLRVWSAFLFVRLSNFALATLCCVRNVRADLRAI